MPFVKTLVESGISEGDFPAKRRVTILSNYVALTLVMANILIFAIIPGNHNIYGFLEMVFAMVIFSVPILLNRIRFTNFSRLYECWLPPLAIIWFMANGMERLHEVPASTYDGLRFYLLATSCIPYLILEKKKVLLFILGILPGFTAIVFCDQILNALGVGYELKGIADTGYGFTPIRTFIAYTIINGICISLKIIIDAGDTLNEKLFKQIADANKLLHQQSETQLKSSEQKYQLLFEQASDAIVIADLEGNLTDSNPQVTQMLGYSREELLKLNVTGLLDGEQLASQPIRFDLLAKGELGFSERRMIRKDGTPLEIETRVRKFRENSLLAIMRDISPRKKVELELREAEAKFRGLVEQSLVGVYIMVEWRFAYVNPKFAEIFGYTNEELLNLKSVDVVIHPEDRGRAAENMRVRLKGEQESVRYELRGQQKTGQTIWLEVFGTRTLYQGGAAIIGTIIDISERKKFEEHQAMFASMVNSSEDAIISKTLDGVITSWNRGAKKLFGYDMGEVVGKHISILIPVDHIKEEDYILRMVKNGEYVENFETQRIKKNGELIYVSLTVSPVRDSIGVIIGASRIARDITARKRAEEEKERTNYLLKERIKELRTLYDTCQILQEENKTVEEAFRAIVNLLPSGWQYPEVSAARITFGDHEFRTSNFKEGAQCQEAYFRTPIGLHVRIELVYLIEKPPEFEGPFLAEERDLINMVAELLRIYLTRKQEAEALKNSEANLNATINNTTYFIWSINRKYELKNINKPFRQYIKEEFDVDVMEGQPLLDIQKAGVTLREFSAEWFGYYGRAMEGESFDIEFEYDRRQFKYSLNPIIENEMIGGVTVFSEEMTTLRKKEKELYEAKKQIDNLKLMALRAAMNPHFIFNTLNSIQYYIMENDQRNAVNYLSTFSKLIRGILNNSVYTRVKLTEELEMLKHYVTLEQMRFENKFDFVLDVERSLDVENIEIPSMLIQPYVENAILHGINNKQGRGKLNITVRGSGKTILFEIEDDGVGRDATRELQERNVHKHKSFGTTLTEERLKLINSQRNISCEVIDLEQGGHPAGTKVKIWVSE